MGVASKYNQAKRMSFNYDVQPEKEKKDWFKLSDLWERGRKRFTIYGFIFFTNQYGDNGALMTEFGYIYIPKYMVKQATEMVNDTEFVQACNDGKVGVEIYSYQKGSKTFYSVTFEDL